MIKRLARALILDRTLYEEVASDSAGLSQAIGVVMLAGIVNGMALRDMPGAVGALAGIAISLVGWLLLSAITFSIGSRLLHMRSTTFRSVAACVGFANIPAVLNLLSVLTVADVLVRILVWFWLLAAVIVAARAAYATSLAKGAVIGGLGYTVYLLIGVLVGIWASY